MAINLNTLTNPATSGDVLAEALTTADFLEGVPVLRNLSRGSNKGGDAKQGTALNQPKALPLDANGKGYLYLSGVSGNYASVPHAANLNGITDFVMEAKDVYMSDWATGSETFFAKYGNTTKTFTFRRSGANINFYSEGHNHFNFTHGLTGAATASIRLTRAGTSVTAELDTGSGYAAIGSALTINTAQLLDVTDPVEIGARQEGTNQLLTGKIGQIRLWKNATSSGTPVLDVDFAATNSPRHGDTKFKCGSGQVVTINQAGNDPATIIKKPVLRFDGVNDGLRGVLNQTITDGYMFVAFTVLGDGGKGHNGRVFSLNSTGGTDNDSTGYITGYGANPAELHSYSGSNFTNTVSHSGLYSEENGDILHEHKFSAGAQLGKVNNADVNTSTTNLSSISSEEFNVGLTTSGVANAAIDLEYLALFSADSVPDEATAKRIRDYINGRGANPIFTLIDSAGYYFYDAQNAPVGAISSGSSAWNGRIVGSDNGDTDKLATQATANDQPVGDGYVVTFADNSDHLDIPSTSQSGYQIVGTSLGTFCYLINGTTAVTELNLLGNLGSASHRKAGQSYGMILLPESATGADIEDARKLLIDRGASDAANTTTFENYWRDRGDIVEFQFIDTSTVTDFSFAWFNTRLTSFPFIDTSNGTNFFYAFYDTRLASFPALDMSKGTNFSNAWNSVSTLTSFPAGAKLGTAASSGVNFTSAWQSSGLTSFPPDIDLSKGTTFISSWQSTNLTAFSTPLPLASDVRQAFHSCSSITSFTSSIPVATNVGATWLQCAALTSFAVPLNLMRNANYGWYSCTSLTDFSPNVFSNWNPGIINSGVFDSTWKFCTALTAQSVENILTSIAASGQHATSTGASGGSALADAGIDIDYNAASGSLSAATNTAVSALKGRGWSIIVNNVTL